MPLYEYHCDSCGKTIEVIQKFSDEPLTVHKDCGGKLEKLISRSAIQFKGSGWYVTEYGKGGVVPKNSEAKSESGGDSKPTETKTTETKPSGDGGTTTVTTTTTTTPAASSSTPSTPAKTV